MCQRLYKRLPQSMCYLAKLLLLRHCASMCLSAYLSLLLVDLFSCARTALASWTHEALDVQATRQESLLTKRRMVVDQDNALWEAAHAIDKDANLWEEHGNLVAMVLNGQRSETKTFFGPTKAIVLARSEVCLLDWLLHHTVARQF